MGLKGQRNGFTLIELLVVIAIIAILAAILFPVFLSAKKKANQARCLSNLKQIGTATRLYLDNYSGRYMYAFWGTTGTFVTALQPYCRSRAIFICPSGGNRASAYNLRNMNAPDGYWEYGRYYPDNPQNEYDRSHYGMNAFMSGATPGTWNGQMDPKPPTDSMVRRPTRVILFCDATFLHAHGYWPGLIGPASVRHNNGLVLVLADCHAQWIPARELLFLTRIPGLPEPEDHIWRWDYRY